MVNGQKLVSAESDFAWHDVSLGAFPHSRSQATCAESKYCPSDDHIQRSLKNKVALKLPAASAFHLGMSTGVMVQTQQ